MSNRWWSLVARTFLCVVILTIAFPGFPLFAQQAQQQQQPPPEEKPKMTEEITVTARKVEETVQEVPFSVVAPTGEELRDLGAETLEDVAANVPGFTVQNAGPGQSQVGMRGVSAGRIIRDQPGVKEQVGIYLDESVISQSLFTPDIDLFDLTRVEVLRGPQGTLFGAGSLAGTVRFITNQPRVGVSESVGEFTLSQIQDGGTGGSAKYAGNVPIGANAAMRIVAYYTQYGGFIDAVQPDLSVNDDVDSGRRAGARLSFRFEPSDRLRITPRIMYQDVDMDGFNRIDFYNILGNPFTTTRPAVRLGEREQFTQFEEDFTDEFLLGDLQIEFDIGGNTLTSITSYTDRDILVIRDATALTGSITGGSIGLPENIYTLDAPLFDATTLQAFTQELRLARTLPRWQWVIGAFYSTYEKDYGQNLPVIGFEALSGIPTRGLRAPKDSLFWSDLHYDFSQYALFGEATFSVTDQLELTGGLRWYNFDEDRTQIFDGIFGNDNNGVSLVSQPGSTDADGVAPRLVASYQLTDSHRLNAQISKGFRLGGINDPLNVPLCTPQDLITFGGVETYKDEELWNYEIGSKSRVMNGRGAFNIAGFYMDIEDLQVTLTAGSCSSRVSFNVPKARSQGVEVEFELAPNDNFDFTISATRTDSELRSSVTSTDPQGVVSIVEGVEEGSRLPTVPEFQAAAAAAYRWQMAGGRVGYATGAYQHVGERFTQVSEQAPGFGTLNLRSFGANTPGAPLTQTTLNFPTELPSYDIINLRLGMLVNQWDIALFVNNVTDETAFLALDLERGKRARVGYLTNPPRTFGITTRVHF